MLKIPPPDLRKWILVTSVTLPIFLGLCLTAYLYHVHWYEFGWAWGSIAGIILTIGGFLLCGILKLEIAKSHYRFTQSSILLSLCISIALGQSWAALVTTIITLPVAQLIYLWIMLAPVKLRIYLMAAILIFLTGLLGISLYDAKQYLDRFGYCSIRKADLIEQAGFPRFLCNW